MTEKQLQKAAEKFGATDLKWSVVNSGTPFTDDLAQVDYTQNGQQLRARYPDTKQKYEQFADYLEMTK